MYAATTNVKPKQAAEQHSPADGHDHGPEEMGPIMGQVQPAANFDSLLASTKKQILSPQSAAEIHAIEVKATTGSDVAAQSAAFQELGKRWQKLNRDGIAAHYFAEAGSLENSEKLLNFAAHLYTEAMAESEVPAERQWMANSRLALLNKVIALNPQNDTAQIDAAIAMMDGGDVMNGVLRLRDFSDKNPNNIRAQIILGQMALQSNQVDKAIERGNKVLALDQDNVEARLFLGEAYKMHGDVNKAIDMFTEAKQIMKNPEFSKEVDSYIATFKKMEP